MINRLEPSLFAKLCLWWISLLRC